MVYNLFLAAFELLIKHEGGYVNDPQDPGGETIYGISRRAHPEAWRQGQPTLEEAQAIYLRDYWRPLRCNEIPAAVAVFLFDTGVNTGNRRAIQFLQRALGVKDDGIIGPITLGAANRASMDTLVPAIAAERLLHIASLSTWGRFGRGWSRRVVDVSIHCSTIKDLK